MIDSRRVYLQEMVLRDGFQSEGLFIATDYKVSLCNQLSRTGLDKIEVTSFVSPKAIPALADAEAVLERIERAPGVTYTVLVPNVRGLGRALALKQPLDEVNLFMSATEGHNRSNLRMSCEESFDGLRTVIERAQGAGLEVNLSLSCTFGCPIEGDVALDTVMNWCERFATLGVRRFSLCDTTGMAYPRQVADVTGAFKQRWPDFELTLHFHNTRGLGLANILAALQEGARRFDASLCGIGGCPYAPGATGNVCTEDVAHFLELEGWDTGIDLTALLDVARGLPDIVGHDVPGQVLKAGPRLARSEGCQIGTPG